ncbi:MAG: TetR/AcrR family transcriptional regulator [Candidatus Scatomorpha sp.]|jgi:AcrR family transcriptional regulator
MEGKVDLRIKRTYKALLRTLQELLSEKSFDDITVAELCEKAEIRRATFYKHFGDKNELFAYMIQDLQRSFNEKNDISAEFEDPGRYCADAFRHFLDFLEENERMVHTVMNSSARYIVTDILSEQIETDLRSFFLKAKKRGTPMSFSPEMLAVLYSGAAISCARWWIINGKQVPKEEMVKQISDLIERISIKDADAGRQSQ